jgi:hypothetical protein
LVTAKTLPDWLVRVLRASPWWVVGLLFGLPVGLAVCLVQVLLGNDPGSALFGGALWALQAGVVGFGLHVRRARLDRPVLDLVPRAKREAVRRAVLDHLQVPSDPEVRETALVLVTDRLADYDRAWPRIRGVGAACAVAGVAGAFFLLPLLWLVGLAACVMAPVLFLRTRARRRASALRDEDEVVEGSGA